MSRRTQTVWIRSEWAFVFQTHCKRHRAPLVESCAVCFVEDPLLPITNLPASNGSLALASCWNCGSSLVLYDPESSASSMVVEIIGLESAILKMVAGNSPDPRWAGRLCAKAFTKKLRILMQRLTTTTDDSLPLFVRIADADSALASLPFRTAASWDANREIVLVLALLADDSPCAPAKFQRGNRGRLRFKDSS